MKSYRDRLYHQVCVYKQRRQVLLAKYGSKYNPEYVKKARPMGIRIKNLNRKIKRVEERRRIMNDIHNLVCSFFDVETLRWNLSRAYKDRRNSIMRSMLCKYLIENTIIRPFMLAEFFGTTNNSYAGLARRSISRKMLVNMELRNQYKRMSEFIKNNADEVRKVA